MSREIKFRAWPTEDDNHTFIYFDLAEGGLNVPWIAKNCEIMQMTGLKDRNGMEIYEGDIVEDYSDKDIRGAIVYGENGVHGWDGTTWEAPCFYIDCEESNGLRGDCVTVIGNIYENPEFLKDKS